MNINYRLYYCTEVIAYLFLCSPALVLVWMDMGLAYGFRKTFKVRMLRRPVFLTN